MSRPGAATLEVRAFRGTRRSSRYRAHVLRADDLDRIREAAAPEGLQLLASLPTAEPHELGKEEARSLAEEITTLRAAASLLELDAELTALAELARWCGRASHGAWLRIQPAVG